MSVNTKKLKQNIPLTPFVVVKVFQGRPVNSADFFSSNDSISGYDPSFYKYADVSNAPSLILGNGTGDEHGWQILNCRVNESRQWGSSEAVFEIARPHSAHIPPEAPGIRPNDVICIEMGYVKALNSKIDQNHSTWDIVFTGKVDTVRLRGGSGQNDGVICKITARDFMSVLVDNKTRGYYRPAQVKDLNRAFLIRDLILRGTAIDYVSWQRTSPEGPYKLEGGMRVAERDDQNKDLTKKAEYSLENSYVHIGNIEASYRSNLLLESQLENGISIMDAFPLDLLRHFSLVETSPRELWADRRSGDIHWMARRSDMRKLLKNPESRQFFAHSPAERVNIISYTFDWSTAPVVTHFTMTNPLSSINETKTVKDLFIESPYAQLTDPHTGSLLRPITRNRFLYDDTLVEETGADAASVAGAMVDTWGRAVETGMIMIYGDASIDIGEVVQVFNTELFGRRFHAELPETLGPQASPTATTPGATYTYKGKQFINPEGLFRVEGITQLFAIGGITQGWKTVLLLGPVDENTGIPRRLIKADADLKEIQLINTSEHLAEAPAPGGQDPH